MDFLKLAIDVGFPIAAAVACGFFIFLTLKFILASVTSDVKKLSGIIEALDNRVKTMNADVIRIDTLVSSTLGSNLTWKELVVPTAKKMRGKIND